ncbi:Na+/H+ antiporter NhaC family protein [Ruminococcaceae bacterium OttesenSCG-928-I18]|nr:Na+/H+ antiporter NhaC family protein [Ruminococcaceae bacterium OttesenSCG-928-I18]
MKTKLKRPLRVLAIVGLLLLVAATVVLAAEGEEEYVSRFHATIWSLLPPVVAIVLALITKEVYISLFVGIVTGGFLYANFHPVLATTSVVEMFVGQIGDSWNVGILIFLVILGVMVALMNKAGGSAAYGRWATARIKSKRGALLSTFGLGVLIFVDDYFNCLTVGSVMTPVTDRQKISRAKLAYIIDATAAPICIIAPISSWAAAVASYAQEGQGFTLFLQAIPYNFYALLTIVMVVTISLLQFDFGPMNKYEKMAQEGDLYGGTGDEYGTVDEPNPKGKVIDLVLPVLVLIFCCVVGMIYTGGFFEGESFIDSFANSDASMGLAMGSLVALVITFVIYIPRKVLTFKQFAACLPEGFRQMVPAIMILCLAWTIGGFCRDALGAGDFVGNLVAGNEIAITLIPAIFFLIAVGLAFATGTSWGTFGILIPIVLAVFEKTGDGGALSIISISAVLAGAVCGDHISPISDTTIMSSAGARVNHLIHVSTQMPYAMLVAGISFLCFILAGLIQNAAIVLTIGIVLVVAALLLIKKAARPVPLPSAPEDTNSKP